MAWRRGAHTRPAARPRAALADTGVATPVLVLLAAGLVGGGVLVLRRTATA
jgi:hypothetical protein